MTPQKNCNFGDDVSVRLSRYKCQATTTEKALTLIINLRLESFRRGVQGCKQPENGVKTHFHRYWNRQTIHTRRSSLERWKYHKLWHSLNFLLPSSSFYVAVFMTLIITTIFDEQSSTIMCLMPPNFHCLLLTHYSPEVNKIFKCSDVKTEQFRKLSKDLIFF